MTAPNVSPAAAAFLFVATLVFSAACRENTERRSVIGIVDVLYAAIVTFFVVWLFSNPRLWAV